MVPETKKRSVGTVTVLFTDVVGSTELLDRFGDDVADRVRRKHFKRLRQLLRAYGGREIKSLGDGLMVVFSSASDAAACAVAVQQAAAADPDTLPVRVGLHTGEASWEDNDLYGAPVVVARRLCDTANGGQILASDLVRGLIGSRGSFSFHDLGFVELKGFRTPLAAAEVLWREHPTKLADLDLDLTDEPPASTRTNLALVTLVGILVVVAIVAVIAFQADQSETPASTNPSESPAVVLAPLRGLSLQWASENLGPLAGGTGEQIMLDLTLHRGRLLAPGRDGSAGDLEAVIWMRSRTGAWSKVYPDGSDGSPGDQMIFAVEGRGDRLVAVGADRASGRWDPAVWISTNLGRRWTRTDAALRESGDQVIFAIADNGSRFVATGYSSPGPAQADAAVWLSRDGRSWTRVPDQPDVFGGSGRSEARDVVATRRGFVAVGSNYETAPEQESDAAVWFSRTGKTWERVDTTVLARPREQQMMSVVRTKSGFLAAGFDAVVGDMDAALWTSRDGMNWDRIPHDEINLGGADNQIMYALTAGPDYVAAAGAVGFDGGEDAALWLSVKGQRWRRMPADEEVLGGDGVQEFRGIVIVGRDVVGAGASGESGDPDGTVWSAKVEGL